MMLLLILLCQTMGQPIGLTNILANQKPKHGMMTQSGQSKLIKCSLNQTLIPTIPTLEDGYLNESLNRMNSHGGDTCIAPLGMWGPVCTSVVSLMGIYPDQLIQYNLYPAIPDTPVYCKLLGMACYSYSAPCCFTLHPRTNTGYPAWSGTQTIIWGNAVTTYPQIQCFSTIISTALTWTWTSTMGTGLGCYNGTNCNVFGC